MGLSIWVSFEIFAASQFFSMNVENKVLKGGNEFLSSTI